MRRKVDEEQSVATKSESGQRGGLTHSYIFWIQPLLVRTQTCLNRLIMTRLPEQLFLAHPSKRVFKAASHTVPRKESSKT
jgi:hypothetical protein